MFDLRLLGAPLSGHYFWLVQYGLGIVSASQASAGHMGVTSHDCQRVYVTSLSLSSGIRSGKN